jgi:cobalt-zinc-cadmium efflux system protein
MTINMAHNQKPNHNNSVRNIKIAFFLNLFFTIIEFIGGFLTNSVAIMSNAMHDLGDSFSLGLAWFLENFSSRKRTDQFSYGYKRFSLLGAFINGIILFVGSLLILTEAIPRLINPETSNAHGMLLLAIFGIVVNGIAFYKTAKGNTMNEKVISLHLLEDVLGWVAVFMISIVMIFTQISILDPILSILITFYILFGVLKNLKATALLFLQAAPKNLNVKIIDRELKKDSFIHGVHDTHIWSLDGEKHILSTHVIINKNSSKKDIEKIKHKLKQRLKDIGIEHSTLEIEFEDESCAGYCK